MSTDDAQKFAEQIGIELYETSAKENINVEEVPPVNSLIKGVAYVYPYL